MKNTLGHILNTNSSGRLEAPAVIKDHQRQMSQHEWNGAKKSANTVLCLEKNVLMKPNCFRYQTLWLTDGIKANIPHRQGAAGLDGWMNRIRNRTGFLDVITVGLLNTFSSTAVFVIKNHIKGVRKPQTEAELKEVIRLFYKVILSNSFKCCNSK